MIYLDHNATTPIPPETLKADAATSRQVMRFSLDPANNATEIKTELAAAQRAAEMLRN